LKRLNEDKTKVQAQLEVTLKNLLDASRAANAYFASAS